MLRSIWSDDRNSWCVCDESITGITCRVIDSGFKTKECADRAIQELGGKVADEFMKAFEGAKLIPSQRSSNFKNPSVML